MLPSVQYAYAYLLGFESRNVWLCGSTTFCFFSVAIYVLALRALTRTAGATRAIREWEYFSRELEIPDKKQEAETEKRLGQKAGDILHSPSLPPLLVALYYQLPHLHVPHLADYATAFTTPYLRAWQLAHLSHNGGFMSLVH